MTREHPSPQADALAALDGLVADDAVGEPWRGVLARLEHDAETVTAAARLAALVKDNLDTLCDPDDLTEAGIRFALDERHRLIYGDYFDALVRYAHRAKTLLYALLNGAEPTQQAGRWPGRHEWRLPNEEPVKEPFADSLTAPDLTFPEHEDNPLAELDAARGILWHMRRALEDYDDAFGCDETCDENGGCSGGPHVPEHMLEEENQLLAEINCWDEAAAAYGDGVALALAGPLRNRMTRTTTEPTGHPKSVSL